MMPDSMNYGSVNEPFSDFNDQNAVNKGSYWKILSAMFVIFNCALFGILMTSFKSGVPAYSTFSQLANTDYIDDLSFSSHNEYGNTKNGKFSYPFLDDSLLVEPYKIATIYVDNSELGCSYSWSIQDTNSDIIDSGYSVDGTIISNNFKKVGEYKMIVSESGCTDSRIARSAEIPIWVKYVRRELLSLTDADREAFLDAYSTLWKVSTVEGVVKYGSDYKSAYYFASIHNDAGGNSVCDEFHQAPSFVNNHVMLGAFLEQSLQLVDPSTCLHYMEYIKYFSSEAFLGHLSNQNDGGSWTELLTDKWFGSNDPVTGRITDGRWVNATVPRLNSQFYIDQGVDKNTIWFPFDAAPWYDASPNTHMMNPYGLLRSPWNWNPSEYITRYNNINRMSNISGTDPYYRGFYSGVTCTDYSNFLNESVYGQSFSTVLQDTEDSTHGYIHFAFGGAGGEHAYDVDEILKSEYGFTDNDVLGLARVTQTFAKNTFIYYEAPDLYQSRFNVPFPYTCTMYPWDRESETLLTNEIPGSDTVKCTLNRDFFCSSQENMNSLLPLFTDQTFSPLLVDKDLNTQCEIMDLIVGRSAYDGEMAGSGSALDPLFWVAHGAVERLVQRIVFEQVTQDTTYDYPDYTCNGQRNECPKFWLTGYHFHDATNLAAENLNNVELNDMLIPTNDYFRDFMNYVYDIADYDFCPGSENWFITL